MNEKPPPYNPEVPPVTPPPPYQPMPPMHHQPMPPPQPAHIGFVRATPGASTTIITSHQPTYGSIPTVVQPMAGSDVIVIGGCPACRVGVLSEEFTLPGLCCAFWFFPIGILCCLAMRERRCTYCGACFN